MIDIGPSVIDLYRYLKTELWKNWNERSKASDNFKDKYFCYATDSQYKPKERHFIHFSKMNNLSPEKIAKDLHKIVINLEKMKTYTAAEKVKKWLDFLSKDKQKDLYHK